MMTRVRASGFLWFSLTLILYLVFATIFPVDLLFGTINLILAASCLFLLCCATRAPYSLIQMFALAEFVLLSLMPRIESNMGITYWGASTSVLEYYPFVSLIALASVWLFWVSWRWQQRRSPLRARHQPLEVSGTRAILISTAAFLIIFAYNGFSFYNVFFRSISEEQGRVVLSQTWWLIYSFFLYPVPSIVLVLYLVGGRRNYLILAILLLLVLFGNPPTGMPRFQAGMLYISILIGIAPQLARKPLVLAWIVFAGLFGIFPFLDLFRHQMDEVSLTYRSEWMFEGHFDSMQNFARAVESDLVTWGWQLVGVLGFFIPRAIWPSKPVGSGHELASIADLDWSNISMNFLGEGYVNFGILGVFIFASFLGLVFGRLDAQFWQGRYEGRVLGVIYMFLIGGTFFLVRGDLMSSFAYLTGMFTSILTVHKLLTQQFKFILPRQRPSRSTLR